MNSHIFIENNTNAMGLKETIAKKILEMKLNSATKHMSKAIQKLQQQFDELTKKESE
jgi:hypothetical protein